MYIKDGKIVVEDTKGFRTKDYIIKRKLMLHEYGNEAIADCQEEASKKGADIVRIWSAALDGRTRPTHRKLDGQIREVGEPFEVDGMKVMQPGGFGIASEDINCRCRLNGRARWALDAPITKYSPDAPVLISDDGTTQFVYMSDAKNYEEFKEHYLQAIEHEYYVEEAERITKSADYAVDYRVIDSREYVCIFRSNGKPIPLETVNSFPTIR